MVISTMKFPSQSQRQHRTKLLRILFWKVTEELARSKLFIILHLFLIMKMKYDYYSKDTLSKRKIYLEEFVFL